VDLAANRNGRQSVYTPRGGAIGVRPGYPVGDHGWAGG
jgi:hypothetical protein